MHFDDITLKKILLAGSYVTEDDLQKADIYAHEHQDSIVTYLLNEGILSKSIIGQAIAESFGVPYVDLNSTHAGHEQLLLIPEDIAKKFRVVIVDQKQSEILITTDNPKQDDLEETLHSLFPKSTLIIHFSMPDDIDATFAGYRRGLDVAFSKLAESKGNVAPEIIDQILEDALSLKASDIHWEPNEQAVSVRFRIDGVLHDVGTLPLNYYETLVNRLKVQAKLRIDEHFSAQDGAIRYTSAQYKKPVDLRISIVPTLNGEEVAIRILSSYIRDLTLSDIGLSEALQKQILKSAHKPFGMILVTGPTGSGKTTTIYSIIKLINTRQIKIMTIEDPAEYRIAGVDQIQVNGQTNLTFAKGLRALMRQDPNAIFVGEIRDIETADIAVNAALTGHLLFSTFHANNAITAIPRCIEMGVEPFLIGSTIELIVAQRLVRRICESCKTSFNLTHEVFEKLDPDVAKFFEVGETLYRGEGCEACSHTGYRGRIGVFEFLKTSPELQDLIGKNPTTKEILTLAKEQGFVPMFEDGITKVKEGMTTIEEVLRVVGPQ